MKKGWIVITMLFLWFVSMTWSISGRDTGRIHGAEDTVTTIEHFTSALAAFAIHDDSLTARLHARKAIEKDSLYSPALYLLSRITDDREEAVELAHRAFIQDSSNKYYLENLGEKRIMNGDVSGAMECYRMLTRKGTDPDHFRILALLYNSNSQPLSAIAVIDSAENRFGRIPVLGSFRQQLYMKTQQFDKAEDAAKRLIEDTPYMPESYVSLAEVYAAQHKDSLAIAAYDQAVGKDSTSIATWLSLADFYFSRQNMHMYLEATGHIFDNDLYPKRGKIDHFVSLTSDLRTYREFYPEINSLVQKLVIRYPGDREVMELYAKHLIASGKLDQALEQYKHLMDPVKPLKTDLVRVIEIEGYKERPDSVAKYLGIAISLYPGDSDMLAMQGNVLAVQGRYDEAIGVFHKAIQMEKSDTLKGKLWGYIGDTEHMRSRMKSTYAAYRKSLKLYADNPLVLNNYAYFLSLEGRDLNLAYSMATRACSLSKNNATYLDTLAWVLYGMGRYEEARKYMQQAISLDQTASAEMALHYGDILDAMGKSFMAQTYWRKAVERGFKDTEAIQKRIEKQKSDEKR